MFRKLAFALCAISILIIAQVSLAGNKIPHLQKQANVTQLIVDDKPFLILGGELGNSNASSLDYMKPIWPKLVQMNLNTVLAPVYWDLIEPQEGKFDWTLVDGLITGARQHNLRLVLLWFGSWKNSMSCYVPAWVKTNQQRFPRARPQNGQAMEILSAFDNENCQVDAQAFAALMRHIRKIDGDKHTVIMVQVENEVGMLQDARDYSDSANKAFNLPVPKELIDCLHKNEGNWEAVFGKGIATDEIFMAWYYARYINQVAAAGKAEYPLPMFVNAALIRSGYKPGQYPSAGPLPHLFDIWRAAAPQIDFFAPDIYFDFVDWCQKYHQDSNPLFIPETGRDLHSEINVFYVIGKYDAMGFCPFSIESAPDPVNAPISKSYEVLSQLAPLILEKQGSGQMTGVLLDKENQTQEVNLGEYTLKISHGYTFKWTPRPAGVETWPLAGGIIISAGPDEYVIAGTGLIVTFAANPPSEQIAGIVAIEEGKYVNGCWVSGRRLNGDENHQGRHLNLPFGRFGIQRVKLYNYH
ncbi:MAG: DUF5597 domain-containing protein [Sedimentisphaerales bacterium]